MHVMQVELILESHDGHLCRWNRFRKPKYRLGIPEPKQTLFVENEGKEMSSLVGNFGMASIVDRLNEELTMLIQILGMWFREKPVVLRKTRSLNPRSQARVKTLHEKQSLGSIPTESWLMTKMAPRSWCWTGAEGP